MGRSCNKKSPQKKSKDNRANDKSAQLKSLIKTVPIAQEEQETTPSLMGTNPILDPQHPDNLATIHTRQHSRGNLMVNHSNSGRNLGRNRQFSEREIMRAQLKGLNVVGSGRPRRRSSLGHATTCNQQGNNAQLSRSLHHQQQQPLYRQSSLRDLTSEQNKVMQDYWDAPLASSSLHSMESVSSQQSLTRQEHRDAQLRRSLNQQGRTSGNSAMKNDRLSKSLHTHKQSQLERRGNPLLQQHRQSSLRDLTFDQCQESHKKFALENNLPGPRTNSLRNIMLQEGQRLSSKDLKLQKKCDSHRNLMAKQRANSRRNLLVEQEEHQRNGAPEDMRLQLQQRQKSHQKLMLSKQKSLQNLKLQRTMSLRSIGSSSSKNSLGSVGFLYGSHKNSDNDSDSECDDEKKIIETKAKGDDLDDDSATGDGSLGSVAQAIPANGQSTLGASESSWATLQTSGDLSTLPSMSSFLTSNLPTNSAHTSSLPATSKHSNTVTSTSKSSRHEDLSILDKFQSLHCPVSPPKHNQPFSMIGHDSVVSEDGSITSWGDLSAGRETTEFDFGGYGDPLLISGS